MRLNEVEIGKDIQIIVFLEDRQLEFNSSIQVVVGDSVLIEPITGANNKTVGFKDYQVAAAYVADKKPVAWKGVSVKLVKYQDKIYHQLSCKTESAPLNRRSAYRQYVGLNGVVIRNGQKYRVIVKDVSTNGCAFVCEHPMNIGDNIIVNFVDENEDYTIRCTIVRQYVVEETGKTVYGCKMHTANRKVEQYIIERQRQDMQRRNS